MRVRFKQAVVAPQGTCYPVNQPVEVPDEFGQEMIEAGFADKTSDPLPKVMNTAVGPGAAKAVAKPTRSAETAVAEPKAETAAATPAKRPAKPKGKAKKAKKA